MQCTVIRRTAVHAAVTALLLTALAACNSSAADKGSATAQTVATEPPTTTTTNPYAVPAVIDAAYVNRVLAGLDAVLGDVTRILIQTRTFPADAYDRLKATYGDNQALQMKLDAYQADLQKRFSDYKPSPGNKVTHVTKLITNSPACIFAEVHRDYSAVTDIPTTTNPQWVGLKPLDQSRDLNGYNPTRWAYVFDGVHTNRSQPPNPCAT